MSKRCDPDRLHQNFDSAHKQTLICSPITGLRFCFPTKSHTADFDLALPVRCPDVGCFGGELGMPNASQMEVEHCGQKHIAYDES